MTEHARALLVALARNGGLDPDGVPLGWELDETTRITVTGAGLVELEEAGLVERVRDVTRGDRPGDIVYGPTKGVITVRGCEALGVEPGAMSLPAGWRPR